MISPAQPLVGAPRLRTTYALLEGHGAVSSAQLTVTALGIANVWINGHPISEDVLSPGWSSYEWRLRAATYDVTELQATESVLSAELGNGWYRGRLAWTGARALYGDRLGLMLELLLTYQDGTVQVVATDHSWKAGHGITVQDDLYDGQTIDARLRDEWHSPAFQDHSWVDVERIDFDTAVLEPFLSPPVRRTQEVAPTRIWQSPLGKILVDFGQNLVGWVRVEIAGDPGQEVVIRHAEILEQGELCTYPLRTAQATDRYVLSGGVDRFEPTLTFHGFRYVELDWPGGIATITPTSVTAVVIGSAIKRIGTFECSDPALNKLHANIVWSMRGNFVDVPTDCPQRDERLGWTGDIAVFAPSAAYLFDVSDFLRDWLRDLALEQSHNHGIVPYVVPDPLKKIDFHGQFLPAGTTAIWGDAAVWVPWALFRAYGDARVLVDQFTSMTSHVDRIIDGLSDRGLWEGTFQFGDWLDPTAPATSPLESKSAPDVIATIAAYRSLNIVAEAASIIGSDRSSEYLRAARAMRIAFSAHHVRDGVITSDGAAVYALAIEFGILEHQDRQAAGVRLAEIIRQSDHRVVTGFAGTPFLLDALTDTGHVDDAFKLLLQTEPPSWLFPVSMGATTMWERWDAQLPDGSINSNSMTSFNHYAFGAVADWMHRRIGGIAPEKPGYATVTIAPLIESSIVWAKSSLETPNGTVRIEWDKRDNALNIEVPEGTHALLKRNDHEHLHLGGGSHQLELQPRPASSRA